MKKLFTILLTPILAILVLGIALPKQTEAAQFEFKEGVIEEGEFLNDNLYIFNDNVDVKGNINGDLVIFGNNVDIDASVSGDVYIFGNIVNLEEKTIIKGNLVLFGNMTTVKGIVNGNTTAFAFNHKNSSSTEKDLNVFASSHTQTGDVGNDARVFAADSTIDANISGELIIFSENADVNEAKVGKEIYTGDDINDIAKMQGIDFNKDSKAKVGVSTLWTRFSSALVGFAGMFIAGALLILVAPVKSLNITKKISGSATEFLASFGVGVGILLLVWIPLILIFVTIIGIPVSILLFGFLLFGIIFGIVWVNLAIGREILKLAKSTTTSPYLALLIGGAVTMVIKMMPYVSGLYTFVAIATAIGAMVRMKWLTLTTKKVKAA